MTDEMAPGLYRRKKELRQSLLNKRAAMPEAERARRDALLLNNVTGMREYQSCSLLFTYVSYRDEADTRALIEHALACGKQVAVPRCIPGTPRMEFYFIAALSDLFPGSYGIPEPKPDASRLAVSPDTRDSLCIVPGLGFDHTGGRLGYGKGYYDRFLSGYRGLPVGLCHAPFLSAQPLPTGRFDARIPVIVTDAGVLCTRPIDPE